MLTALIEPPRRLIYLSSGHLDWTSRTLNPAKAYAESKLHAVALARRWPGVLSNAVDPGWVRTKMGGPGAPVDIETGQRSRRLGLP